MLEQNKITNHGLGNFVQTLILFGGMLLLLALIGLAIAGTTGLWWATVLGLFFLLFGRQISPQWVLRGLRARPLQPQEAPDLYQLIEALSRRAQLAMSPRPYYVPQDVPNAFTVGSGREAVLGVTAGLLQRLDRRELTAVLAHEISHIQHNDMRLLAFAGFINRMTSLFSGIGQFLLFINFPLLLMGRATISWLAILLMIAAPTLSGLLQLAISRTREFKADLGAVKLTGDPVGLASALRKLEQSQASWLQVLGPGYRLPESAVLRSHPNTKERIDRLLALSNVPRPASGPSWHFTV